MKGAALPLLALLALSALPAFCPRALGADAAPPARAADEPVLPGAGLVTPELTRRAEEKAGTLGELSQTEKDRLAGVDEKPGTVLPKGIIVHGEDGAAMDLYALIGDTPVLLAPVYYSCPATCHLLLSTLARTLPQMGGLAPGKEYRVLSVSFDETDTPALALHRKENFLAAMDYAYPPEAWRFLTADKENINKLMDAVGFRFSRLGRDFIHPTVLIAVSPQGKITRYLYGQSFMPFDLTMALTEAAEGKVGTPVKRMISYCFTYDPQSKRYVFDFMRVAGVSVLAGMLIFFGALIALGPRRKRKRATSAPPKTADNEKGPRDAG